MAVSSKSMALAMSFLGNVVTVVMDRPLGSVHPKYGFTYTENYGFVPKTSAPDGAELDAYYLGDPVPYAEASGVCVAVVHRENDDDDKLVVVPVGTNISDEDIAHRVHFQEQWFVSSIIRG